MLDQMLWPEPLDAPVLDPIVNRLRAYVGAALRLQPSDRDVDRPSLVHHKHLDDADKLAIGLSCASWTPSRTGLVRGPLGGLDTIAIGIVSVGRSLSR